MDSINTLFILYFCRLSSLSLRKYNFITLMPLGTCHSFSENAKINITKIFIRCIYNQCSYTANGCTSETEYRMYINYIIPDRDIGMFFIVIIKVGQKLRHQKFKVFQGSQ